ncbi:hypothetical protein BJX76DRAFT_50139 [Aspergillus varians]
MGKASSSTSHLPDDTLIEQVSGEMLSSPAEARNTAPIQPEETQHLFNSFELFNPSASLENLPEMPQHHNQLFYNTWSASADSYFNPSASLESLPATFQQNDMQPEETQSFNYLAPRFNPSGYFENLPQIPENSIAFNNTEPTAIQHPRSNLSASLESPPGTFRNSIALLLNNTQPHNPSKTHFTPSLGAFP